MDERIEREMTNALKEDGLSLSDVYDGMIEHLDYTNVKIDRVENNQIEIQTSLEYLEANLFNLSERLGFKRVISASGNRKKQDILSTKKSKIEGGGR